ncbi:MAG: O-methyltransferase [Cytophagales bacterium]|jgi:predicted O-methyltransferase YrrM|nr:class I SAM-dependent methyltransferase [Bacteroidota bacterium]MBS1982026.1 class I SAM-dependent methyltransferase [Bacteroidota bacterium]WHZ09483.1 MAG: O-methyltransferase [Cytophagales bacterium]
MDFLPAELQRYIEQHTDEEGALLKKINRDTHANVLRPRMLSGQVQGRYLSLISKLIKPKTILEIGTYTGYSAICLAEGLAPTGKLITLDINAELENKVRNYFNEAGLSQRIDYRIGDARKIIPQLKETFDLVFIDADKENYSLYYDLVIDKVLPGGILMADNVLWSGKVVDPQPDKDTRAILEFNRKVQADSRVENLLLSLRDGIMMMYKK